MGSKSKTKSAAAEQQTLMETQMDLMLRLAQVMEELEKRLTALPVPGSGPAPRATQPVPFQRPERPLTMPADAPERLREGLRLALVQRCVWIPGELLVAIYRQAVPEHAHLTHRQLLRCAYQVVAQVPECSRYLESYPHRGEGRRRGVAWRMDLAREGISQLDDEMPAGDN